MKIKASLFTLFIGLISFHIHGQSITATGQLQEASTNTPIPYATVSLLSPDNSFVSGTITDDNGAFNLKVNQGEYMLLFQFVAFEDKMIDLHAINQTKINLGIIKMEESLSELEEVVIQGERTQMELNLDKKVYNVGKDLSNMGGTATDILDNLPSVTVDVEGNVELRGSSNVQVLIDGKPSGLVGLSSTDALRQLQGNMIETIEIITNPSARYDAAGMSGIINIILKKEKKKGVNGSFQVNTGVPNNHGASINANFRREWVNFFINYGANLRGGPGGGYGIQQFNLADTSYMTRLNRSIDRIGLSNNVRLGADFYLGERTTLTTSFLYRYSNEENRSNISYEDFDLNNDLMNYTRRQDLETEGDQNLEYAINFTRNFDRKGHKLTADIQYQNNLETEDSNITQFEGNNESSLTPFLYQRASNEEGEERLMIQSDYIQPFGEKGKIELGVRSTMRDIRNIYAVDQQDDAGVYQPLDTFSTNFSYDENVHAGYAIISNEMNKISWQAGLRVENTNILADLKESNRQLTWNYTNFFPSFFLTYKLPSENQLQFSYSRRINRPRFRELNPFSSFSDNRNFRVGNPNVQPEFTDSYEFGLLQNVDAATFYYGIYYRYTTDLIQRVSLEPNEQGQRVTMPFNIGFEKALGLEMNAAYEFTKWYRVSGNFNFYRSETIGSVGDSISLAAQTITFTTRASNNFKVPNLFDGQININYRAPQQQTQGRRLSITSVDVGLTRDVFNNNGTIALSARDLFNSRKYRSETILPTFYEESTFQWRRGPQFILTFTYRLNQKKQRPERGGEREFDDDGGF